MLIDLKNARVNYKGQGLTYIEVPEKPSGMPMTAVIAIHGSGRGATDYINEPFYRKQRDIALENGCLFAVISNVRDTWGTDDGLYNVNLLTDYVKQNYCVKPKAVLWATSAGGTVANRMVKEYPDKVELVIGTFPVYDLISGFALSSCKAAWKTNSLEEFKKLIINKNPADFYGCLKNHRYYLAHGTADSAVPYTENSKKLQQDVGDNVYLQTVEGGEHSTDCFEYYSDAVQKAFSRLSKKRSDREKKGD